MISALTGQLGHADNNKQRGVFDADDPLVTQRRQHAAQRQRQNNVADRFATGKT